MSPTHFKKTLIALFSCVFLAGFIVNAHQAYFAVALVVILAIIVFIGGKVDKEKL